MTYKKTWLSYLLWAVYTCLTGVMLANYAILFWQKKMDASLSYGTAVFVFLVFAAAAGVYFLIRRISGRIVRGNHEISSHTKLLWEIFAVLSILFAGLLYRVFLYLKNIDFITENSYYQFAAVKAGNTVGPMVHGASYLYTMCLSFVLSFLGNKIAAAVCLQIFFQMVTLLLAFFVVRGLAGRIPACIAMLVLAVSSVYAGQILTMTPESLFFLLYLTGIFIVGDYVKNDCGNRRGKLSAVMGALLSGIIIGLLAYLDAVSLTLFVLMAGLVTGIRPKCAQKSGGTGFSLLLLLAAAAAGGLTFAGMLALNAYSYHESIGAMTEMLAAFYRTHFRIDYVLCRTEYSVVECLVIVILAFFLIPAFWNRKKRQNATPWICLMLLLAPTPLTAQGVLPYQVYSVFLWGVLAGIGLQQSFVWESAAPVKERCEKEEEAPKKEKPAETAAAAEVSAEAAPAAASMQAPNQKPRFLENPLPQPKRHEKRTMDYQYEVREEQMKFDIEVKDNDDFDIE
ncbi:MAG: hypothetical protein NC341_02370 [Blautia sp.]|nr:hypothetical protein [Blautia sp.]MCM1200462.1 hypothetical protein [Bacteroides fragilis]